jgi:chromosome partitioning protein
VLAFDGPTQQDGAVTMPDEDVAARGRSIFERLRAEQAAPPAPPPAPRLRWQELDLVDAPAELDRTAAPPPPAAAPEPTPAPPEEPKPYVATPPVMPDLPAEVVATPAPVPAPEPEAPAPVDAPPEERPSFARPLPRIVAIANQKGGVGKTTTTVNLGASLAVLGYRVLVVDLDPQGNATTGLGINSRNLEHSIYDVILHDVSLDDCVEPTSLRNLYVAPATIDLAGAEIELVPAFSRELRLRRALEEVRDDYDFVLIDCPPSLGLLTVNGLAAATEVLVPIQCEYYALEGLGQLLRNVNLVQSNLNPKLELSAIVLTMYDARTKLAEQVAAEVRTHFGPKVCRNVVPRTVRLSEAPSFGQPIIVFDPSSRGALAYRELAKEVAGGAPQRAG